MKPVVDGLASTYAGRYDIRILNLSDGDAGAKRLYDSFGLRYVPSFVFVNTDGTVSATIVGSTSAGDIETALAKLK
jgi:hypothetical protein